MLFAVGVIGEKRKTKILQNALNVASRKGHLAQI